jgi:hypothetical protein
MSILQEILEWSKSLPDWESDALHRLFMKKTLAETDLEDLYTMLKAEHGISDIRGRKPTRLTDEQVPAQPSSQNDVKLIALKNLCNVNRIAPNQRLVFNRDGMTIVYGDNGSGKSGYSRVLKRACRARYQGEDILPNAFLPRSQIGTSEAVFEFESMGTVQEFTWKDGQSAPHELSTLSVFDSLCARSYLDDEGEFSYMPYGFGMLKGLADVCAKLKEMTDKELSSSSVDIADFADLNGDTKVGKLIGGLSYATKPEQVEALSVLSAEELSQMAELESRLNEGNPQEKAQQLRLLSSRITRAAQSITKNLTAIDDQAVSHLHTLVSNYETAKMAAALAAKGFIDDHSLLPGTGGAAWKALFEAARGFSIGAYTDKKFPLLGPMDRCPLCQQPLAEGSERLQRFEKFVQADTEKTLSQRKQDLEEAFSALKTQTGTFDIDSELYDELASCDETLSADVHAFEQALKARLVAMESATVSKQWDTIVTLPETPGGRLGVLAKKLAEDAQLLTELAGEEARKKAQSQLGELKARVRLAERKTAVLKAIERLCLQKKLKDCLPEVKTNAISVKSTELIEKVISKELADVLNDEYKKLGVDRLHVSPKSRTDRGKGYNKLVLDLPQAHSPGEILSEGEQRAIALGSFLAEIKISGNSNGIIFDDPVSSLDHRHREQVARRLVAEAKDRQVIIFTHDLYFMNLLIEESEKNGTPYLPESLSSNHEGFGIADVDIPFEGMNTKKRVAYLKNKQSASKKFFESDDVREYKKETSELYRELRDAWERAVEEVLFQSVVLRFRKSIETRRLTGVVVTEDDYATVDQWMKKCSNYAHDQALLGGTEMPRPEEVLDDINALESWRASTDKRSTALAKEHKAKKVGE